MQASLFMADKLLYGESFDENCIIYEQGITLNGYLKTRPFSVQFDGEPWNKESVSYYLCMRYPGVPTAHPFHLVRTR